MIYLIIILLLIFPNLVNAEMFVCHDVNNKITKTVQGDCKTIGICSGFNNTGMDANCFEATKTEFDKAKDQYVKFDPSVVSGSHIVNLTQAEKDALIAAEAQAIADAEAARLTGLDNKMSAAKVSDATLAKVDVAIDGIQNLVDAKAFLKKLARYLVSK